MPPGSAHPAHFVHGPIPEYSLAVNIALPHGAKITTVIGQAAMIAQHKIAFRGNYGFSIGALVLVIAWHIVLIDRLAVDKHPAGIDLDVVPRQADDSLDKALRGIPRITEHDNIAALDWLQPVHELVHEDAFLIFERRHHACTLYFYWLVQEDNDETGNGQRADQVPQPDRKHHGARRHRQNRLTIADCAGLHSSGHMLSDSIRIGVACGNCLT